MKAMENDSKFLAGWFTRVMALGFFIGVGGNVFAAGYRQFEVPASGKEPAIKAMVWSPCAESPGSAQIGPYVIQGTPDCAIAGISLPLIVFSHGQGGTLLGHYDTATTLADAGFVVVTLNHPGDTYGDESAAQQLSIFESRPRDVSRVISFMLAKWPQHQHLDTEAIGVFGFSRGGYTALALIGAVPSLSASADRICTSGWLFTTPLCRQIRSDEARLNPRADSRIRAAVVVDPLNLFDAEGLKSVHVPVQLWASELGGDGVSLSHSEFIRSELPQEPELHVATGAGHFAYMAPCSPALKKVAHHICDDPEGFDRSAWHRTMNAFIITFFRQHLQSGAPQ